MDRKLCKNDSLWQWFFNFYLWFFSFFCLYTLKLCWKWRLEFFYLPDENGVTCIKDKVTHFVISYFCPEVSFPLWILKFVHLLSLGIFPVYIFHLFTFQLGFCFDIKPGLILACFIAMKFAYIKVIIYLFFLTCIFFSSSLLRYNWQ